MEELLTEEVMELDLRPTWEDAHGKAMGVISGSCDGKKEK